MKTYVVIGFLVAALSSASLAADEAAKAGHLLRAGKVAEAISELKPYLMAHPEDMEARLLYGQALAWDNDYKESEAEYQIVLSSQPANREALLGLAQLRAYQERFPEALSMLGQELTANPQDEEFLDARKRFLSESRQSDCDRAYRYVVRSGYYHEAYSFTDPGNGAAWSLQDRQFHGWNAAVNTSYEHRFKLDDVDVGLSAAHDLPWGHSYGGFTLGGATRSTLLPTERTSLFGGLPLGFGFSAESEVSYRHYTVANVYALTPTLTWEKYAFLLTAGYSLSDSYYTSGGRSGSLNSYSAKAGYVRWCRLKPWVAYAHTKEAFEEGFAGVSNFRADHYTAGGDLWLIQGWSLSGSFSYENRPDLIQHINRFDIGLAYSWGAAPKRP